MCWVFCLSPWMTMEHSISIIHCSIITIYPIIHYNSQWIQLISREKKKTWFELNMLKNKYKQTNQNDVNALDDGEVVTHSRILTHTHTHIHRYTSRYALAYIRYTESKCLTFPIWIECQVLWSTVLELKMAGFIRTSSIKAYMSKRSIITPILFYYGAQRWVHFMSTIKKKRATKMTMMAMKTPNGRSRNHQVNLFKQLFVQSTAAIGVRFVVFNRPIFAQSLFLLGYELQQYAYLF